MTSNRIGTANAGIVDLKRRLLFVLLAILVFRIGTYVPVPGLNPQKLQELFNAQQNNIIGLFNMFSGGALQRFSIFALGIMPYISASIIIQLLTVISPQLSELRKEGESGQRHTLWHFVSLGFSSIGCLEDACC
jgi:preprotein translocase subunit SecY